MPWCFLPSWCVQNALLHEGKCMLWSQAVQPEVLPDPNSKVSTQCPPGSSVSLRHLRSGGSDGGDIRSCCCPWKQAVNSKQVRHGVRASKPSCAAALQPQLPALIDPTGIKRAHQPSCSSCERWGSSTGHFSWAVVGAGLLSACVPSTWWVLSVGRRAPEWGLWWWALVSSALLSYQKGESSQAESQVGAFALVSEF